jgi:hypothetical protein
MNILPLLIGLAFPPGPAHPSLIDPPPYCSIVSIPGRDAAETFFLATADDGTRVAGAGPMRARLDELGVRVRDERVLGRVMRLERVGGGHAADVEDAFRRNGRRDAVLVAWGVDALCNPHPLGGRWPRPGARGVVIAKLRPMPQWAGGMPTFDLFPADIYPDPSSEPPAADACPGGLSAEEFYAFLEMLPARNLRYDVVEGARAVQRRCPDWTPPRISW